MSNRASLKILAFAASDSPKSSIKIAKYRGEKAYGHSLKCQQVEGFASRLKVAESSTQLISKRSHVTCFWKVSVGFLAFNLPLKIYV